MDIESYNHIRSGGTGIIEKQNGLTAVWGKEAVPFLDGMITNDMKTLPDGGQMLAAFPNAQGRLLAVVRALRQGDRYLIETESETRERVFQNLHRFTFAGDFFVEDLSESYQGLELINPPEIAPSEDSFVFSSQWGVTYFARPESVDALKMDLVANGAIEVPPEVEEVLRIEAGRPRFGVDVDENTIVPELGFETMISYTKGCYIGQEIIARIHFRGHVAKRLTGVVCETSSEPSGPPFGDLTTVDGKNAGRITSATYSPKLKMEIGLAFVRYDFLADGTELKAGDRSVFVRKLPFAE